MSIKRYIVLALLWVLRRFIRVKQYINLDEYTPSTCVYVPQRKIQRYNAIDQFVTEISSTFVSDMNKEIVQQDMFWRTAKQMVSNESVNQYASLEKAMHRLLQTSIFTSIKQVTVHYTSVDVDNQPITLSGKLYLPSIGKPKGIIVANHYTIGSNDECPSRTICLEAILASKGYAVVMADYLGYGISRYSLHPYLYMPSVARSVVDLLRGTMNYLCTLRQQPTTNNIYLVGYSQGAAVTLGVQRLIEQEQICSITKVFAGAGPYAPAATYDYCVRENTTGIPCAIPMLVQGMNIGEKLGLDMKDFFLEPLLSNYNKWINSKNYTMIEINHLIGSKKPLDKIMTKTGLDKTQLPTKKFYHALKQNEVINWTPQAPVYLFHSTEDDMVPFLNSKLLRLSFEEQCLEHITYDFDKYGLHMQGAVEFLHRVYQQLP